MYKWSCPGHAATDFGLGSCKASRARGDAKIAHLSEQPGACEREAVHRRDEGLRSLNGVAENGKKAGWRDAHLGVHQLLQIHACAERSVSGARQNRGEYRGVFFDAIERGE